MGEGHEPAAWRRRGRRLGIGWPALAGGSGLLAQEDPLAASGARLALTLLYELRRRGGRYGVASACIGGGQGIAVIFEALPAS